MAGRTATLQIVMDRDFDSFDDVQQEKFLAGLSEVTGCTLEEMANISFRPGCVVASVDLPDEAVRALIEMWLDSEADPDGEMPLELREFLTSENVQSMNAKYQIKLQIIASNPSAKPQVVFVHGWTGDRTTFGDLPGYIEEDLGCRSEIFDYPSGKISHSPSIFFLARALDNWFRNHIESNTVGFVVHSMGGLVVRKFITLQEFHKKRIDDRIRQLTFIASPHDGADLAAIAKKIPGLNSEQISELSARSAFVAELKTMWERWVGQHVPDHCQVRSVFGTNDKVVSPANAIGCDEEPVPILGADHANIVKPTARDSEIVLTVERFLDEAGFRVA